ncbi:CRISPR-associated endonuclease Cas2 [Micromonospora rifamycinica]|uniref:CRISPR-associated endonuclease Cas2 n=1 Tax=Micromonospora rifamycinica TaxID=291594 RepID=UPI00342F2655
MPTILVAYGISTDTTCARTAAMLQTWGDRIQRSVFVCTLDTDDLHHLSERLHQLVNPVPTPSTSSPSAEPAGTASP